MMFVLSGCSSITVLQQQYYNTLPILLENYDRAAAKVLQY